VTRIPEPSREAQQADKRKFFRFGAVRSILAYFAWPRDFWTQPYWPAGSAGKVRNFLRGNGWRVT
jgi:hypothetical protein